MVDMEAFSHQTDLASLAELPKAAILFQRRKAEPFALTPVLLHSTDINIGIILELA